jgi:hypothetical protein
MKVTPRKHLHPWYGNKENKLIIAHRGNERRMKRFAGPKRAVLRGYHICRRKATWRVTFPGCLMMKGKKRRCKQ